MTLSITNVKNSPFVFLPSGAKNFDFRSNISSVPCLFSWPSHEKSLFASVMHCPFAANILLSQSFLALTCTGTVG